MATGDLHVRNRKDQPLVVEGGGTSGRALVVGSDGIAEQASFAPQPRTTTAAANPTVNDDTTLGYVVGSHWVNTTTDEEFVCANATDGAAVWKSTTADVAGESRPFKIYMAVKHYNRPDLTGFGVHPIPLMNQSIVYPNQSNGPWLEPNITNLINYIDSGFDSDYWNGSSPARPELHVLDIEVFSTRESVNGASAVNDAIRKLKQIIDTCKKEAPDVLHGLFSIMPVWDFSWHAYRENVASWDTKWLSYPRDNTKLSLLARSVDIICPELYAYEVDQAGFTGTRWSDFCRGMCDYARQYFGSKPVIPFLWPKYYGNVPPELNYSYVPANFWRTQLETVYGCADSVIIWEGNWEEWNPNAPWWVETLDFMDDMKLR